MRTAIIERNTSESQVTVRLALDQTYETQDPSDKPGVRRISSGQPFLDHMLNQVGRHGNFYLNIQAQGDLEIDSHHTTEDIGLTLGLALKAALGERRGIVRYGAALVPLDEALCRVVIDLSGRPFLYSDLKLSAPVLGSFETETVTEFYRALANTSGMTLHVECLHGVNTHHIIEASFKAFGRALRQAIALDPGITGIPSTKGLL
ncbi:MAG: imidazoleglycerol-phosphate dehydratase HisB [Oscillospiraceae bacterium]|nr:imidazoleglycerol-phosphate dehydratase HisB [Oscillospiraceae bacterium]MDD4367667.1 imidazoleglycerol-phosphate dehydratase HisB [Oscillospiraceae bacterium]